MKVGDMVEFKIRGFIEKGIIVNIVKGKMQVLFRKNCIVWLDENI